MCIQNTCLFLPQKIVVNKRQESSSKDLEVGKWCFLSAGERAQLFFLDCLVTFHFNKHPRISSSAGPSVRTWSHYSERLFTRCLWRKLAVHLSVLLSLCYEDSLIGTELTLLLFMVTPPRGRLNPYLPLLRKDLVINSLLGDAAKEGREGDPKKRLNY